MKKKILSLRVIAILITILVCLTGCENSNNKSGIDNEESKNVKQNEKTLNKEKINKIIKETYSQFFVSIIPICIAVITFCFMRWIPLSSFGMVMFWGITLIAIYNLIITGSLLKIKADKK